jgi:hypothetical protein
MRVAEPTLQHLVAREIALIAALMGRGHGAQTPIVHSAPAEGSVVAGLEPSLRKARRNPRWSTLSDPGPATDSSARANLTQSIADLIVESAVQPAAAPAGDRPERAS